MTEIMFFFVSNFLLAVNALNLQSSKWLKVKTLSEIPILFMFTIISSRYRKGQRGHKDCHFMDLGFGCVTGVAGSSQSEK